MDIPVNYPFWEDQISSKSMVSFDGNLRANPTPLNTTYPSKNVWIVNQLRDYCRDHYSDCVLVSLRDYWYYKVVTIATPIPMILMSHQRCHLQVAATSTTTSPSRGLLLATGDSSGRGQRGYRGW